MDVTDLKAAEESLREANDKLELRVAERTAELQQTNKELRAQMAERRKAEVALQKANETLEIRVAERTAELSDSQHRLAVIVDSIADGFFAIDRDWRFIHINDAALQHFGKVRKDMEGHNFFEVFPQTVGGAFETGYRQALETGEPAHFEVPSLVSEKIMEVHAYPSAENLTVLFRDITEKHRLETALRVALDRSEWMARFPEENPNPVLRVSDDGNILYCNPTSVAMSDWACRVSSELPEPIMPILRQAITEGQEALRDIRIGERYYSIAVIPISGKGYANIYGRDATSRKQAEAELQIILQRFYLILSSMHIGILMVTDENKVEFANDAFCNIFALQESPDELTKISANEMIAKIRPSYIDPDAAIARISEIVSLGQQVRGEEIVMQGERTFLRDFIPIHIGEKKFGRLWVHMDITSRKQAEDKLAQQAMQLQERTARLEEINKELESFSYSVSHDLRAPLRAIDGFSRMILKNQGDKFDEETKTKFNVIRGNAQKMGQLIDDLLDLSRLGKKQMSATKINMAHLSDEVWQELQTINTDRVIKLTVKDMPDAYGDRTLIRQLYFNLLGNAIKFTKHCSTAKIEVGSYSEGKEDVYYIKDNGAGFDMAYYDKLFGVFQRLHNTEDYEGTGIGLAIVQRIIHRHGGRVWAEGEVDKGATFYFTLPCK